MRQSLASEKYKGITINVIKNILPNRGVVVEASMKLKGKFGTVKAPTKTEAVVKAKKWIDRII